MSEGSNHSYSSNKRLIAESLKEHLVIEHEKDENMKESVDTTEKISDNGTDAVVNEKANNSMNDDNNQTKNSNRDSSVDSLPDNVNSSINAARVTMVRRGEQSYTKITSPGSAFTPTRMTKENRSKRLKNDPHLQHLMPQSRTRGGENDGSKPKVAPLLRSTSMPVSVESEFSDGENSEKNTSRENFHHRTIFRTGSVSDYTRQKLKTSILMRTSASLVRKPSITEQEIRHLQADADSSLSDEDEEEAEDDTSVQFKPVSAISDIPTGSETAGTLSCGIESGAVDKRREHDPDVSNTSLVPPPASHAIAITTT